MTIGDIKTKYPNARILSEKTGYSRDYSQNPYSGYNESENFIFSPSAKDARYPSKTIFVAFKVGITPVAIPWLTIENEKEYSTDIDGKEISFIKRDGKLFITDANGAEVIFYFEMWFSWAVQNGETGVIFDPNKQ